jgi:hypothetical protein
MKRMRFAAVLAGLSRHVPSFDRVEAWRCSQAVRETPKRRPKSPEALEKPVICRLFSSVPRSISIRMHDTAPI